MRYPDPRVAAVLRSMATSEDAGIWEYSAVAATALGSYVDDETLGVLISCLSSPLWYVRFNAAKTLYDAGLSLEGPRLAPIMAGGDRYAKDMLRYRWEIEAESARGKAAASCAETPSGEGELEEGGAA